MKRYTRSPNHDRRIRHGDDFAGDAWLNGETGQLRYFAVGADPNSAVPVKVREIPPDAVVRPIAFMGGADGWAQHIKRNDEYGVNVSAVRENKRSEFVVTFTQDEVEGAFDSLEALNAAIRVHNGGTLPTGDVDNGRNRNNETG